MQSYAKRTKYLSKDKYAVDSKCKLKEMYHVKNTTFEPITTFLYFCYSFSYYDSSQKHIIRNFLDNKENNTATRKRNTQSFCFVTLFSLVIKRLTNVYAHFLWWVRIFFFCEIFSQNSSWIMANGQCTQQRLNINKNSFFYYFLKNTECLFVAE